MKHTNLEDYVSYELGKLVRPSKREAIKDVLHNKGIWKYKDLCAMKEKDFKNLSFVDDTFLAKTKAHLEEYGLRFGMTEDEIIEYMDKEYLVEHPEEAEFVDEHNPTVGEEETDETLQPNPDTVAEGIIDNIELVMATEPSKRQDPSADDYDEKESVRFHTTQLLNSTADSLRGDDLEFMRFRFLGYAFYNQPWYYRFLYNTDKRVRLAKKEADKLFATYVEDAVKRTVYIEKKSRISNKETSVPFFPR